MIFRWRFFYGENFFSPLVFAKSCFFVPKIIFLRIWRQWQSVARTLSLIRPEIKLVRTFKPVLVKSNFDDDLIKNEQAGMEIAFSNYKSMGNFLDAQGQLTPWSEVRSGWNSNSSKILCMSSLPASIKRIGSKSTDKRWRHCFPHYKSMGAFCCHGNQSSDPICPKTICSLFPTPVILHIKFDQDWPTGFRDIQVWKCAWGTTYNDGQTMDHWYTISSPCEPLAQVS